jgi:hypothetical protein
MYNELSRCATQTRAVPAAVTNSSEGDPYSAAAMRPSSTGITARLCTRRVSERKRDSGEWPTIQARAVNIEIGSMEARSLATERLHSDIRTPAW